MKMPIFTSPPTINEPSPALITAAPAKPPMRAWDELVGRPQYQVMRFQTMAPINPAKTTAWSTTLDSTTPFPTVVATLTPKPNAATKLKNAAQATACKGERTRVDTTVAMELAASWNPLMKSKTSATTTMSATTVNMATYRPASPERLEESRTYHL